MTQVVRDVLPWGNILLGLFVIECLIKARNIDKYCKESSSTIFTNSVHRVSLSSSSHHQVQDRRGFKFFTNTYHVVPIRRCSIKTP